MTPAEGVKRAAQALSLLWPFAVIAAVSFGRMSLLLVSGDLYSEKGDPRSITPRASHFGYRHRGLRSGAPAF